VISAANATVLTASNSAITTASAAIRNGCASVSTAALRSARRPAPGPSRDGSTSNGHQHSSTSPPITSPQNESVASAIPISESDCRPTIRLVARMPPTSTTVALPTSAGTRNRRHASMPSRNPESSRRAMSAAIRNTPAVGSASPMASTRAPGNHTGTSRIVTISHAPHTTLIATSWSE
jgi:hypothetical protein